MDLHFTVDYRHHGKGEIVFCWHPHGLYIASSGTSRVVHVLDRNGEIVDQIVPPSPSACTALHWDKDGETLAILQEHSSVLILWSSSTKTTSLLDVGIKELTFLKWSKVGPQLAIGTAKGNLLLYNKETGDKVIAQGRHKKRIICGDWNLDNQIAYASEDKQITISNDKGIIMDQMNIKSRPLDLMFGGKKADQERTLSVNMEGRTILLYNMQERDNALELAFQSRYGTIVSYRWFGDGYILAGFSSGSVVVISTHLHEIGREQMCAKFFSSNLRDIAHCPSVGKMATCSVDSLKIVDMSDWAEVISETLVKEAGKLDHLQWSPDGRILSVSSKSGCLYFFHIKGNRRADTLVAQKHSALVHILGPLSPTEMAMALLLVFSLALAIGVHTMRVTLLDLLKALLGLHATV